MTKLDVIKAELVQSFEIFTRYFFNAREHKKFIVSEHHKKIIDILIDVFEGRKKRLIINIAPRYGKTELAVKSFIAYSLACNPKAKFIHLSYADQLALDNSESIKDLIQSEEYQNLFPEVQVKKDSKAKNKWYTTQGGGVLARSASGQVTGFGAGTTESDGDLFGGAIIIDDPLKPEDAESETVREKVNKRFDSTIRNRVNSRDTPIIIIMQRLHPDDLTGYLIDQEPDVWEVIKLPAIKNEGTKNELPLWEKKHTLGELYNMKELYPDVFERQYQQNPQPLSGLQFAKKDLNYYNGDLDTTNKIATLSAIDIADEGKDYHVVLICHLIDNKVFVHDVVHTDKPMLATGDGGNLDMTIDMLNNYTPDMAWMEINYSGTTYPGEVRKKLNGKTALLTHKATTNKIARINTEAGFIRKFFYFRDDKPSEDYTAFMSWLWKFNKEGAVKHDDGADCLQIISSKLKLYYADLWN